MGFGLRLSSLEEILSDQEIADGDLYEHNVIYVLGSGATND
jgi:hypothetical protein